jgi:hypothetical protein
MRAWLARFVGQHLEFAEDDAAAQILYPIVGAAIHLLDRSSEASTNPRAAWDDQHSTRAGLRRALRLRLRPYFARRS